ncbi:MAG TPA: twin-arginine translocation signal domain-containing protein [Stellaceae bacterium]|nr:twin-arginine translocation signal domain-containing protein [Stellaceae bacterium]
MAVSRRRFLRSSSVLVGGLGLAGLVAEQAQAKVAPNLVGYQTTPKDGHDCAGCKLFEPPAACKSVDGVISPNGWCKLWLKA